MSMINDKNDIINDTPKKTDDMVRYRKEYYKNNKETIKENSKIKIKCDICNCEVIKQQFKRHQRSKKHLNNLNPDLYLKKTDDKDYHKKYYQVKIKCNICDCEIKRNSMKSHQNSKKHINAMKIKEMEDLLNKKIN